MKRKEFIRAGLIGGTGLLFFPSLLLADNTRPKLQGFELPGIVPQPRHGNFCAELFELDSQLQILSRDRFLQNGLSFSDEDLLSINFRFKGKNINLSLSAEECWLNTDHVNQRLPIRGSISSITTDLQLIQGYTNIEKCSVNSKLYLLPLVGSFTVNDKQYLENECLRIEGFEKLSIESAKNSRLLLLSA